MKRIYKLISPLLFVALIIASTSTALAQKGYEEGVIRIKFKETQEARLESMTMLKSSDGIVQTGIASVDQLNVKYKISNLKRVFPYAGKYEKKHKKYGLHLWYELEVDSKADVRRTSQAYQQLLEVALAEAVHEKKFGFNSEENGVGQSSLIGGANDERYPEQWHYNNTGQTGGTADADVDLPEAWAIQTGSTDVIVSVHDGGIDGSHPDLDGNLWTNPNEIAGNGIDDDNNGYIDDVHGYNFADGTGTIPAGDHGTHVGGTVAAETNNEIGMAGVAGGTGADDGVRLMSCVCFGNTGNGGFEDSYIYAADNGSVISQNSWGYSSPGVFDQVLLDAIDYFIAEAGKDENGNQVGPMAGGIVIFAAGNDGQNDEWYPGYYEPILAVAGTDHNDNKYTSSNFGAWVEMAAPAVNVASTVPGNSYANFSGTSMACPHVSGVAALIVSQFKDDGITPQQVWDRLVSSTDPLSFDGADDWGTGRLNAFKALAEDDGMAPTDIVDVMVGDVSAINVALSWTAPADQPDNYPAVTYDLRYSLNPIAADNFEQATQIDGPVPMAPGEMQNFTVKGLSPGTMYYFALKSSDFFGNTSGISNTVSATTLPAPEVVVEGTPDVAIDLELNPVASAPFTIQNQGTVDLTFNVFPVYNDGGLTQTQSNLLYPGKDEPVLVNIENNQQGELSAQSSTNNTTVRQLSFENEVANSIIYDNGDEEADGTIAVTASGTPVQWMASSSLVVPDMGGEKFILSHVSAFIEASGAASSKPTGLSVVLGGDTPSQGELVLMQEFNNIIGAQYVTVALEMPISLETGDKVWVVFDYPDVPLRLGYDDVAGGSRPGANLVYLNSAWEDIQNQPNWGNYVWNVRGIQSSLQGLTLDVSEGTVASASSQEIQVTYDAEGVTTNGEHDFNIFVLSNDPLNPVTKVEATATITGAPNPALEVTPMEINASVDVNTNPVQVETLTIANNGNAELQYDFTGPVVDQSYHIPAVTGHYPKGMAASTLGIAPKVSTETNSSLPVAQLAGSMAYGMEVYPGKFFMSLSTDAPGTYTSSSAVTYTAYAGDFAQGDDQHMYIVDHDESMLKKLNIETGALESIGATLQFADLACDKTSGVMYASNYSEPVSELYTINLSTGAATKVGDMGEGIMVSIACDGEGNLWGLNLDDNIYAIDKNDGHMTLVGNSGFDPNYAQSMAWDPATDLVYLAAYNNASDAGELRVLDTETGATELIGAFPGNAEVTAFGFPGGGGSDFISVEPLAGTVAAGASTTINVEIDATMLPNGEHASSLTLYTNDINKLSTTIPVNVEVSGQTGEIVIAEEMIEMGTVFVNDKKEVPFFISNSGIGDLTIASITGTTSLFTTDLTEEKVLSTGDSLLVKLVFKSNFLGQFNDVLTVSSNDQSTPTVNITVTANAISPPVISLEPAQTEIDMDAGQLRVERFTIKNTGLYPLQYSMPAVALNQLLANPDVVQNNTSRIDDMTQMSEKGVTDTRKGNPVLLGAGGPDDQGYAWIDSKETGGPVFVWTEISETGIEVAPDSDDGAEQIELPFAFKFYGESKSAVTIASNGFLTFGTELGTFGGYSNKQIPTSGAPDDLIAPFWDDLRPSARRGQVFYQASPDKFIVQYHEVGTWSSSTGTITFQVVLYPNGNIEYLYKDVTLANSETATVGTENMDGSIGLQVAFNTAFVESNMAVLIFPGKTPFDVSVSPLSGIVQPNQEQSIDVTIDASELVEDSYINELLISSNDPLRPEQTFTTLLNVKGFPKIGVNPESLVFEPIFQNLTAQRTFNIENTGSKDLNISSITSSDASFTVDFESPINLAPEMSKSFIVTYTALNIGETTADIIISSDDTYGNEEVSVAVSGTGIVPPEIGVSTTPSPVEVIIPAGEMQSIEVAIANTGGSDLAYTLVKPFYSKVGEVTQSSHTPAPALASKDDQDTRIGDAVQHSKGGPDMFGYTWLDSDESAEVMYEWMEISGIGTKLDLGGDDGVFVDLPFSFPFYNGMYAQMQVASNGFITFGTELGSIGGFSNQDIPDNSDPNTLIAPLWDDIEPQNGDGVYYYSTSDYAVVQYNQVPAFLGSTYATFQAIIYANGDIRFQYKDVESYSGVEKSTVGIENEDGTDALSVVFNNTYLKNELALLIKSPFVTGVVAPGVTSNVELVFDATDMYDGIYEAPLKVLSNDPASQYVEIPTSLTVIGIPEITLSTDMMVFDPIYFMDDQVNTVAQELMITNTGTKALEIESVYFMHESEVFAKDKDGAFTLQPEEELMVNVSFTPNAVGSFSNKLKVASNDEDMALVWAELQAEAIAPPVATLNPTSTLKLHLRSDESVSSISTIGNEGASLLNFDANVVYLPDGFGETTAVSPIYQRNDVNVNTQRSFAQGGRSLRYQQAAVETASFINSIIYDPEVAPDDYYGYNGSAAYSAANKFTVTSSTFKLTHIANYYQNFDVTDAVVLEIYKGGTLPAEGELIATQAYTHAEASGGANCFIELNTALQFVNGDEFFVVMHYPQAMTFPAGFNNGIAGVEGVSYWYDTNSATWLNEDPGYVYKIRAYEAAGSVQGEWLNPSLLTGEVEAGTTLDNTLYVDANAAKGGFNYAKVVYNTNDPLNSTFEYPVELYVNQLPVTMKAADELVVNEGQVVETIFEVVDPEGGVLEFAVENSNEFMTMQVDGNFATVTYSPDYEQAGTYGFIMHVTDDMGESISLPFTIVVNNVNRMPVVLEDVMSKLYFVDDARDQIDLNNYFIDPDGEDLVFTAYASSYDAFDLEVHGSVLSITPRDLGTAVVTVLATDPEGAHTAITFNVRVRAVENHAPELVTPLDNIMIWPEESLSLDLGNHFVDPDWDEMTYSFTLSGTASVNVSLNANMMSINPYQTGMAVLTIYADDSRGGVTATTVGVIVLGDANGAPYLVNMLDNRSYNVSDSKDNIDLNEVFADPENDNLTFIAKVTKGESVEVEIVDNVLQVNPLAEGTSEIIIYASDEQSGIAYTSFNAEVGSIATKLDEVSIDAGLINYPNPVVESTTFAYNIETGGDVRIEIVDLKGNTVDVLIAKNQTSGEHKVVYKAHKLASGMYFYRLIVNGEAIHTNRMVVK
ncbi:S8 family serine peptidase [Carboxylicivirga sp. N1Y90]|uniref:Ig-like domain-containing protein n=1 Tax=Carboxylicivirga fragile TaxID=3417571 RepID=UPI003D32F17B|nr:S8 family serine peptidase [Marinilabiliaceae bacterium N1Y90]